MMGALPTDYSRLPPQLTSLLGREHELRAVEAMLRDGARLVTLTGPAGVGKTRLALEVGARLAGNFNDGVAFIDLAPVRDPDLVLPAIAGRLGLQDAGTTSLLDRLTASLQGKSTLLILDNFEHVLPAATQIADLLGASPQARILVTSRVPVLPRQERALRMPPLSVPHLDRLPDGDELARIPAVALFLERAISRRPEFALTAENARLVAELVVQLDGLPLAIELAAARMDVLPLSAIAARLGDRLNLLRWDAPDVPYHHRSLHAAIAWSHDLLSERDQRLFRRLGVFVGGASLAALEAVLGTHDESLALDSMVTLAEKSLVLPGRNEEQDVEPRFAILETMREFACEQLGEQGELEAAEAAHAGFFVALAERADVQIRTAGQSGWLMHLEQDHDNLRYALRRLLDRGRRGIEQESDHQAVTMALRLATALGHFWWMRGYQSEGWRWLEEALALDARVGSPDPALRSRGLVAAGRILACRGEDEQARLLLEEAFDRARVSDDPVAMALALTYQGVQSAFAANWARSASLLQEALERWEALGDAADPFQIGVALIFVGANASMHGAYEEAAVHLEASLDRFYATGDRHTGGHVQFFLALILHRLGERARAVTLLREGLLISQAHRDRWQLSLGVEAALLLVGDLVAPQERARLLGALDTLQEATGFPQSYWARIVGQGVTDLRPLLQDKDLADAYQEGRSLTFDGVADLTLTTLAAPSGSSSHRTDLQDRLRRDDLLSPREQDVLRLVADGLSDKQIARRLEIGERTVRHQITSIFDKLGADNRPQAVAIALRQGLI